MRTHKQLAGGQRRTLAAVKERLLNMAAEWDEVDQFCMNAIEELADKVQETSDYLVFED
jgi:hypothetical protein